MMPDNVRAMRALEAAGEAVADDLERVADTAARAIAAVTGTPYPAARERLLDAFAENLADVAFA